MGHLSFHRETPVGVVEGYCSVKDIVCVATIHADVAVAVAVVIEFADGALCPKVEVIALWNAPIGIQVGRQYAEARIVQKALQVELWRVDGAREMLPVGF